MVLRKKPSKDKKDKKDKPSRERRTVRTNEDVAEMNSGDKDSLEKFVTHHGKILPQRATGISAKQQRKVKKTVKQARNKNVI